MMKSVRCNNTYEPFGRCRGERAAGLLLGIAAADKNGGPQRMAMRVATSQLDAVPSLIVGRDVFATSAMIVSYFSWFVGGRSRLRLTSSSRSSAISGVAGTMINELLNQTHSFQNFGRCMTEIEPDQAFDTGVVFSEVFSGLAKAAALQPSPKDPIAAPLWLVAEMDHQAKSYYALRQSAGVSPAHRNSVIAALGCEPFASLQSVAKACAIETKLTHHHPEAIDTSIAVGVLCRCLIEGCSLGKSLKVAQGFVKDVLTHKVLQEAEQHYRHSASGLAGRRNENEEMSGRQSSQFVPHSATLHRDGRSPLVLEAALYFVCSSSTFTEALHRSIEFAGGANYCPVLVGSIGGALWGTDIATTQKQNHQNLAKKDSVPSTGGSDPVNVTSFGVEREDMHHYHCKHAQQEAIINIASRLQDTWAQGE